MNGLLIAVIVACEIGFWVFVLGGLAARYLLKARRLSNALLLCAPLADVVLLVAAVAHLHGGAVASGADGLAAIYIGCSVAFGHRMINWADRWFAYRFAGGPRPARRPKYGSARAAWERATWLRHLLAWAIGCALLMAMVLVINDADRTQALSQTAIAWSVVLGIDAVISFSYTLFPRREQ